MAAKSGKTSPSLKILDLKKVPAEPCFSSQYPVVYNVCLYLVN